MTTKNNVLMAKLNTTHKSCSWIAKHVKPPHSRQWIWVLCTNYKVDYIQFGQEKLYSLEDFTKKTGKEIR